jgi:hypothetical protein
MSKQEDVISSNSSFPSANFCPEEAAGCSHCADVGVESHNKVQQADQKVL